MIPRALLLKLLSDSQYIFSTIKLGVKRKKIIKHQDLLVLIMKQTNDTHTLLLELLSDYQYIFSTIKLGVKRKNNNETTWFISTYHEINK